MGPIDEDSESFRPVFTYGKPIEGGYELYGEAALLVRGGGFLDAIIEWWHDHVIREHDPVRASTPKGRAHVEFPGSGGAYGSAFALGDTTIGLAKPLGDGVLARVAVKLPTGNPDQLAGSGAFDAGAALDWRTSLGPAWTLDLNGALVVQGEPTRLQGARTSVVSSAISLTYQSSSRDAWTLQWNAEQSPTRTGDPGLDSDHRVLSFGYQRLLDDDTVLQLYFSENGDFLSFPGGPTVGPDLTIAARVFRRT